MWSLIRDESLTNKPHRSTQHAVTFNTIWFYPNDSSRDTFIDDGFYMC